MKSKIIKGLELSPNGQPEQELLITNKPKSEFLEPKSEFLELTTKYDSAKSFYKKANVEIIGNTLTLYSYTTKVAQIKNSKAQIFGLHSDTTLRRIKKFLKQNGFKADTKSQIWDDYGVLC